MTVDGRRGASGPRVLLISAAGQAFAELIRAAADKVEVRAGIDVFGGGLWSFDLVVLHTPSVKQEFAALAALPPPRPPVLVVVPALGAGDVLTALRSGALSILVEGQYTRADLLDAVTATAAGQSRLSPGPLAAVVEHVRSSPGAPTPRGSSLTPGEIEVMELLAAGESNPDIAERLALAEKTVRNRVSQIYLKLRVNNRTEAIVHWLTERDALVAKTADPLRGSDPTVCAPSG